MALPFVISLGAGLASAILFLSTATGSLLAMLLFFVVALPGFIAGLGWGTRMALVSGLVAAGIVALAAGAASGAVYLVSLGLPVALICYLALLARPAEEGTGTSKPGDVEWYPPGQLIAWTTLLAGGFASLSVPLLGFDAESYRGAAKEYFESTILSQLPAGGAEGLDKAQLEPLIEILIRILPATSAIVWMGIMLLNMWGAQRIVEMSGHALRPTPTLITLSYPRQFPLGFVAALMLTLAPGIAGIVATGFAGAFLFAYVLLGLAVAHTVARRSRFPAMLLAILYLALMLIGWVALLLAVIGLSERVFKIRERVSSSPPPPGSPSE